MMRPVNKRAKSLEAYDCRSPNKAALLPSVTMSNMPFIQEAQAIEKESASQPTPRLPETQKRDQS
jgi:hypothetical protein